MVNCGICHYPGHTAKTCKKVHLEVQYRKDLQKQAMPVKKVKPPVKKETSTRDIAILPAMNSHEYLRLIYEAKEQKALKRAAAKTPKPVKQPKPKKVSSTKKIVVHKSVSTSHSKAIQININV